jgi:hypothetical protein
MTDEERMKNFNERMYGNASDIVAHGKHLRTKELAPDIDKAIARMNSTAHNDGGSAPSDAGKSATKGSK